MAISTQSAIAGGLGIVAHLIMAPRTVASQGPFPETPTSMTSGSLLLPLSGGVVQVLWTSTPPLVSHSLLSSRIGSPLQQYELWARAGRGSRRAESPNPATVLAKKTRAIRAVLHVVILISWGARSAIPLDATRLYFPGNVFQLPRLGK
jgi:hypothetical protein